VRWFRALVFLAATLVGCHKLLPFHSGDGSVDRTQRCVADGGGAHPKSCSELHCLDPNLGDGEYWINPDTGPVLAYCDMQLGIELCTTIEGEHEGRTRDDSHLQFVMRSVLTSQGTCEIWAVRGKEDNHPLDSLVEIPGMVLEVKTCQALGFKDDQQIGHCGFGRDPGNSDCGFSGSLFRYGNHCYPGCTMNPGHFTGYLLQGPMFDADTMSTMDGTVRTICKTR
jgi:hypothetical protein